MEFFKKYFDEVENCYVREFGENFLICEKPNDIEKELGIKKNTIQKAISRNYNQSFGYKWGYKEVM